MRSHTDGTMVPCPSCGGTEFVHGGDRHTETRGDRCPRRDCVDGWVPARTGETLEASASWETPADLEARLGAVDARASSGTWSLGDRREGRVTVDASGDRSSSHDRDTSWGALAEFVVECDLAGDGVLVPSDVGEANAELACLLVESYRSGRLRVV